MKSLAVHGIPPLIKKFVTALIAHYHSRDKVEEDGIPETKIKTKTRVITT